MQHKNSIRIGGKGNVCILLLGKPARYPIKGKLWYRTLSSEKVIADVPHGGPHGKFGTCN